MRSFIAFVAALATTWVFGSVGKKNLPQEVTDVLNATTHCLKEYEEVTKLGTVGPVSLTSPRPAVKNQSLTIYSIPVFSGGPLPSPAPKLESTLVISKTTNFGGPRPHDAPPRVTWDCEIVKP